MIPAERPRMVRPGLSYAIEIMDTETSLFRKTLAEHLSDRYAGEAFMRMFCTMMVAAIMASSVLIGEAQAPASAPAQPAASAPATSSDILQPALEN